MRNVLIVALIGLLFASCKKDDNMSNDYDLPIVVEDTTAEFNVLFYGNFCVNCPNAHYKLYVDEVYLGEIDGCYEEGDCSCDNNPFGLHTIIAPGVHSYKAVPYCAGIENGELVDIVAADWCLEEEFVVPEDNCVSIYISKF